MPAKRTYYDIMTETSLENERVDVYRGIQKREEEKKRRERAKPKKKTNYKKKPNNKSQTKTPSENGTQVNLLQLKEINDNEELFNYRNNIKNTYINKISNLITNNVEENHFLSKK